MSKPRISPSGPFVTVPIGGIAYAGDVANVATITVIGDFVDVPGPFVASDANLRFEQVDGEPDELQYVGRERIEVSIVGSVAVSATAVAAFLSNALFLNDGEIMNSRTTIDSAPLALASSQIIACAVARIESGDIIKMGIANQTTTDDINVFSASLSIQAAIGSR